MKPELTARELSEIAEFLTELERIISAHNFELFSVTSDLRLKIDGGRIVEIVNNAYENGGIYYALRAEGME